MDQQRRRPKVYGKKVSKVTKVSNFVAATPESVVVTRSRSPLKEVTASVTNLNLGSSEAEGSSLDISDLAQALERTALTPAAENDVSDLANILERTVLNPTPLHVLEATKPLRDVYAQDRDEPMTIMKWNEALNGITSLEKLAEASFAQVFRVSTCDGTSILKFIELKIEQPPNDLQNYEKQAEEDENVDADVSNEDSEDWTAQTAEPASMDDVVSEFRIMNALADVPGFLKFKDAHIVMGKPPQTIQTAYDDFRAKQLEKQRIYYEEEGYEEEDRDYTAYFPSPDSYSEDAVFLFLELGDAGVVLDDLEKSLEHHKCPKKGLEHVEWVWDILLGAVIALARAEELFNFEHRDLHQNNICINLDKAVHKFAKDDESALKLGRSGVQVTILDYGLSRATLESGDEIFLDLEHDLAVFQSEAHPDDIMANLQFDTYRRMRTHLFFGTFQFMKASWHTEASKSRAKSHTWQEHIPYTNALWIGYIFEFLFQGYMPKPEPRKRSKPKFSPEQKMFEAETKEIRKRLTPGWRNDERFTSAGEVLEYAVEQGWISPTQVEEYGAEASIIEN
ncbi:hypothetical protein BP6252_12909 [Coleophoma cylindrospora]|uniref:non-specific serine/threonine protein kinase n=1 Tax=Coleophoma cylindrospora TaxID=1849047 RepID=A0A3D8QD80_9HELO|nr:hypothetical protein BP6252_12909 [Coleophoma cylindrospora]